MSTSSILPDRLPLTVETRETEVSRDSVLQAPYLPADLATTVATARVVFVPDSGRGHYKGPVFHSNTPELRAYLAEKGLSAEVPVADDDYHEVALHADIVWLGTLWVGIQYADALLNLITNWLALTRGPRLPKTDLDVQVIVENEATGKRKAIKYSGPATECESTIKSAIKALNGLKNDD